MDDEPNTSIEWVLKWFSSPSSAVFPTPENDREWCFVAAALLLMEIHAEDEHCSTFSYVKKLRSKVHHLLTYLLLGWNPYTGWKKTSAFDGVPTKLPNEIPVQTDKITETYTNLLNFGTKVEWYHKYVIYNELLKLTGHYHDQIRNPVKGEEMTMLILSCWLLARDKPIVRPTDRVSIRACLDLYHKNKMNMPDKTAMEYVSSKTIPYESWLHAQIDRLFNLHLPMSEIVQKITYFTVWASAIRAERILRCRQGEHKREWWDHAETLLNRERQIFDELLADDVEVSDIIRAQDAKAEGTALVESLKASKNWKPKM